VVNIFQLELRGKIRAQAYFRGPPEIAARAPPARRGAVSPPARAWGAASKLLQVLPEGLDSGRLRPIFGEAQGVSKFLGERPAIGCSRRRKHPQKEQVWKILGRTGAQPGSGRAERAVAALCNPFAARRALRRPQVRTHRTCRLAATATSPLRSPEVPRVSARNVVA